MRDRETLLSMRELCQQLPLIMHRAGQLGMFRTMHALHEAVRQAGDEAGAYVAADRSALAKEEGSASQERGNG
jgi:hypothetical protein